MAETYQHDLVDPVDFVAPNSRLFIDTNVFMDTSPRRKGGIKRLLQRCGTTIRENANPVIIVTKVKDELTSQSQNNDVALSEDRMEAVRRAGIALQLIEDAESQKLVRTDVGHPSNPYADDLFVQIFDLYAGRYAMCLLTNDITLCLRIRLIAGSAGSRLVAGALTSDGLIEVDRNQTLYERGATKLQRKRAEGDQREVDALESLLDEFQRVFGTTSLTPGPENSSRPRLKRTMPAPMPRPIPFAAGAKFKGPDRVLAVGGLPSVGDKVNFGSPVASGSLVLGEKLGNGREGTAYEVEGQRVVKVFFEDQITEHRKQKLSLLTAQSLEIRGICFPEAIVTNHVGEFVGYVMPKANGQELKQTIFNPRRFKKAFPDWTKTDLVVSASRSSRKSPICTR